jgi:crotonobetainyl-CoA:carnitine CoA-transferase CaiB-like acyl-CoA transferase
MPEKASSWAVYDPFKTSDGKTVFVGITSDNHWRAFCTGFGVEHMLFRPELQSNPQRAQRRAKIMPVVTPEVRSARRANRCAQSSKSSTSLRPAATPGDLFEDRHLNEGGRMLELVLPTGNAARKFRALRSTWTAASPPYACSRLRWAGHACGARGVGLQRNRDRTAGAARHRDRASPINSLNRSVERSGYDGATACGWV